METIIPVPGFHGETCTANLYRSQNNAFLPEKSDGSRFFHVEADVEWSYIESRDRIPARVSVSIVGPVPGISTANGGSKTRGLPPLAAVKRRCTFRACAPSASGRI